MTAKSRPASIVLSVAFLGIIWSVPLTQIGLQWSRGEPVQATDLFRRPPSVKNLRRFETDLEDQSWGQRLVRPAMQRLTFAALGDVGPKAVVGRDGWLFYRPGIRYLAEPNRLDLEQSDSRWVDSERSTTCRDNVVQAIVTFRDQLSGRGVKLLVVPVPGKASLYPDRVTRRIAADTPSAISPTVDLLRSLDRQGVATVDLLTALRRVRARAPLLPEGKAYYLARDTHWTPSGVAVAAQAIAGKLRSLGWTPAQAYEYSAASVPVERHGDIPQMLQLPGVADWFAPQAVDCMQVLDAIVGPLVPRPGDRPGAFQNEHLIDTPMEAEYLLLGDSFSRIYQTAEPASLGRTLHSDADAATDLAADQAGSHVAATGRATTKKRLLPGSAGLPSQLASELQAAVDYILSDGGAGTDVRRQLAVNPEIFQRKRVVIWQFAERDIHLGRHGWTSVPLPAEP